jgi:hypothetical protein
MTGPAKAKDLISQGIKDLEDLRSLPDLLNPAQQIGLALFADFETRIPRREVGQLFAKAKAVIGQLNDGYRAAVCGSYRSLFIYCSLNHCMKHFGLALDFKGLYHSKGICTVQCSFFFLECVFLIFSRKYAT